MYKKKRKKLYGKITKDKSPSGCIILLDALAEAEVAAELLIDLLSELIWGLDDASVIYNKKIIFLKVSFT